MDLGDADHRRAQRIGVAADDRLERRHDMGADEHRVDAEVRHGAMGAVAANLDVELVGRRHDRAGPDRDGPGRQFRPIVDAVDFVYREQVERGRPRPSSGRRLCLPRPAGR